MTTVQSLASRAEALRQSLDRSHQISQEACRVLDQYCSQLSELERIVQPVVFKTQALTQTRENVKQARAKAEEVLDHLDASRKVESRILQGPRPDLPAFMAAFKKLDLAISFLQQHRSISTADDALRHATDLQKDGLRLCFEEFTTVLKANLIEPNAAKLAQQAPAGQSKGAAQQDLPLVPGTVLPRLHTLAQAMLQCRDMRAFKAFCDNQKELLEDSIASLPNQAYSGDDYTKMSWAQVEKKVTGFVQAVQVGVQIAVAQVKLCTAVFDSPYAEAAFDEIVAKQTADLTKFGQGILQSRRASEKVFGLLDMHDLVESQMQILTELLSRTNSGSLLRDIKGLQERMRTEVQETFSEVLSSVAKDSAKHTVPDGSIHPLTATTLSFLKRLFTYRSALQILFADITDRDAQDVAEYPGMSQQIADTVLQVLDSLLANLLAKAKTYKNKALSALFLMNNVHYMVKTVEGSPSLAVIGEEWIEQHKDQVEQYGEEYQSQSWGPLITLVKGSSPPARGSVTSVKDKATIKETLLTVNGYIQSLQEQQSQWSIPDHLLRSNMKDALAQDFLPVYKDFLEAYKDITFTKTPEKYFKYSVKDMQTLLIETFSR